MSFRQQREGERLGNLFRSFPNHVMFRTDTICGRAIEDRDLLAEIRDEEHTAGAVLETIFELYPPTVTADGIILNPMGN